MPRMQVNPKNSLDSLPGTFNERVFIAGDYRHGSILRIIEGAVILAGMKPILLYDLDIKPGTDNDSAEAALRQCKFVIFDVSSETIGWGMEMQIVGQIYKETQIVPLCVWDRATSSKPKVAAMVTSHRIFKNRIRPYSGWRELEEVVYKFLKDQKLAK